MTTRRLMIAVGVAAVIAGLYAESLRIGKLQLIARGYREKAALYKSAELSALMEFEWNPYPENRFLLEQAEYWGRLRSLYAVAADSPWLPTPREPRPPWADRPRARDWRYIPVEADPG
jgi:hypothetical protein